MSILLISKRIEDRPSEARMLSSLFRVSEGASFLQHFSALKWNTYLALLFIGVVVECGSVIGTEIGFANGCRNFCCVTEGLGDVSGGASEEVKLLAVIVS